MKPLDAALAYAARGWMVFPIRPGGKIPSTKNGFKDASRDHETIRKWFSGKDRDDRNIGIVCGPESGTWSLDCDIDKETGEMGEGTLAELERVHGVLPPHPIQITPSGGQHHVFAWPDDGKDVPRKIRFMTALDALGSGGYLLATPSATTKGEYSWKVSPDDVDPPQAPAWLLELIRAKQKDRPEDIPHVAPVRSANTTPYGRKTLDDICSEIAGLPWGEQDVKLIRLATRVGSLAHGGDIEFNEAFTSVIDAGMMMANKPGEDKWTRQLIEKKVRGSFNHAKTSPTPRHEPKQKTERPAPRLIVNNQRKTEEEPKQERPQPEEWNRDLDFIWKDDGLNLKPSHIRNTQLMIEFHPELRGMFTYNAFTDQIIVNHGLRGDKRKNYPRQLTDHDEVAVSSWLNLRGLTPPIATVAAVIREIASRHEFDPLVEYLTSRKWDGDRRIDTWMRDFMGAADNKYTRLVSRKIMISAVARAMSPGCKVDTMPIVEGRQGILKSTAVKALFGAAFFTDQVGDVTSKDSSERLQGAWAVEIPEMDKFTKAEANAVKDFLSRTEDRFRPSYGRNVVSRPRRCIFFGTINPNGVGYLKDTTGNRRFWPVKVTKIDVKGIEAIRDQLWAEAMDAFLDGEEWWISDADIDVVTPEQDARRDDDVWEHKIAEWLDGPTDWMWNEKRQVTMKAFTSSDVLSKAIGLDLKFQGHSEKIRVAKIMPLLGCTDEQHKNGIKNRSWEYVRKNDDGKDN